MKKEQEEILDYIDKSTSKIDQTIKKIEEKIELLEEFKAHHNNFKIKFYPYADHCSSIYFTLRDQTKIQLS